MPKLDDLTANKLMVPESLDTNSRTKPLASGAKIRHDRDTAAGMNDISAWTDENDKTARAAAEAAKHALDWISASGGQSTQWADATNANIFAGYGLSYLPVGRDPGSQIPFETIDGVLNNAGSWNIYVTLPASIPVSRIRVQNRLTADGSVQATLPAAGSEWAATSFAGLHEYSRAYRLVLSSDTSAPETVVLAGGSKLVLQISNNGEGDVLEELEDRKTIGLTDSPVLRTLSQTKITDTFVDTGQPLNAAEDATIWAIDFNNVLYQFSPVSVGKLGGSKVAGTDTINGENEIELGAFGAVVMIEVDDGVNLGFAAKSPIEGTVNVRQVVVGPDSDGIDRQISILQELTQDIQVPPSSTGWVDATLDSQGGIYIRPDSNIISPPADLAEAQALTDSDFALRIDTVGQSHAVIRLPAGHEPGQARTHLGNAWGAAISEGLNTFIYLGQSTDRVWDLYASPTEYGSGVAWIYLQVTSSVAHVGKTIYRGTLTHEGVIDAIGEGGIDTSELAGEAVTGDKLAGRAVTKDKLSDTLQQEISDVQTKAIAWRDLLHLTADTQQVRSTGGVSDALTFTVEDLVPKRPYEFVLNVTLDITDGDSQDRTNNFAPYLVIGDTEYPLVDDDDRKDINGYSAREATFVTKQPLVFWPETDTQEATLRFKAEHDFSYVLDGGSVLLLGQGISATSTQQALFDFDDLPDPNLHDPGNVIIANDKFYKLGVSAAGDGTKASDYKGTVGDLYRSSAFGGEKWTGISSIYGPAEVSTEGEWTANYDNAIALIAADDERFIQVAIKRSVYRHFRGSSFREQSGTLFMQLVLESGARDEVTLAYFDYYDAVDEHRYLVFQHQNVELNAPDYNLYDEPLGNSFTATFYAGDDTTATLITHPADAKHWIVFAPTPPVARDTRLRDLPKLPNADDYNSGDLVPVDDLFYKLATTDATRANLFSGDVGRDTIHTTSAELWRGLSNSQSPGGFSTGGEWTANPNNAISFLIASSSRRLRVATKKSVYEAAKGSEFNTDDHVAIKVTMADGTTTDEAVLEYYNQYLADTDYIIWEHRHATDNYNLYSEASGNVVTIEFFTTTGDPPVATTTPLLTHAADMKHWLLWAAIGGARNALALAQANQARLDALDIQVGEAEPVSVATYDDSNTTLVVVYNHDTVNASKTITNVESTDLVVIDWTDFETYPDWDAYLVPGSTPARGRLHIQASAIGNRYFGYGTDILRIEGTTTPSPKSSVPFLHLARGTNSISVDFYHSNVGATASGRYVPPPGFSLKFSIYRNADALETIGSRIATLDSPEGRRPRKGDGIATLPFHFTHGFNNQSWYSLNTDHVIAGADATGSLSQELKVDIRHYAQNSLGFIAEMMFTDLGDHIVASRIFVPWSAIPIDGTQASLAIAYHQIEPSQEATTEVLTMNASMAFSDGESRPLSFIVPGGNKPRGLTGDNQGRTGVINLYEAV